MILLTETEEPLFRVYGAGELNPLALVRKYCGTSWSKFVKISFNVL